MIRCTSWRRTVFPRHTSSPDESPKTHAVGHSRPRSHSDSQGPLYSTTEGRQRFPDFLQTSYGDKAVIGFGRYGRALGAVVSYGGGSPAGWILGTRGRGCSAAHSENR